MPSRAFNQGPEIDTMADTGARKPSAINIAASANKPSVVKVQIPQLRRKGRRTVQIRRRRVYAAGYLRRRICSVAGPALTGNRDYQQCQNHGGEAQRRIKPEQDRVEPNEPKRSRFDISHNAAPYKIDLIDCRASALPAQSGIDEAAFGYTEDTPW
jgi:hypothetical protein